VILMNPFEDPSAKYLVLVNEEGQYSLWPTFVDVPRGWEIAHHMDSREACLGFIKNSWKDMRPKSLINAMDSKGR
jgi:MbtH protein